MACVAELLAEYKHGSAETLDYSIDWTRQLAQDSDAVASSEWVVERGEPTIGDGNNAQAPTVANGIATIWVVGGSVDDVYVLSNRITTEGGRVHERSLRVVVVDR